jgi:hypothetical protein
VSWEFAVVLLNTLSGFLTIFYENDRRVPCLFTQLNLQEDSPVHISQYKFYGTQQPTPNAVKQAFEKQQKESYDLGAGSALLARTSPRLRQDFAGTSPGLRQDFARTSPGLLAGTGASGPPRTGCRTYSVPAT